MNARAYNHWEDWQVATVLGDLCSAIDRGRRWMPGARRVYLARAFNRTVGAVGWVERQAKALLQGGYDALPRTWRGHVATQLQRALIVRVEERKAMDETGRDR